jgi:hypothetical protein
VTEKRRNQLRLLSIFLFGRVATASHGNPKTITSSIIIPPIRGDDRASRAAKTWIGGFPSQLEA